MQKNNQDGHLVFFLKMMGLRENLLPTQRIRAIQEELTGFLMREVIDEVGDHYMEDKERYM
jgi:hypothetical protein